MHCLTRLTSSEQEPLKQKFDELDERGLELVTYRLVPWLADVDGTQEPILRIDKQQYTENRFFHFFIDRQKPLKQHYNRCNQDLHILVASDDAKAYAQQIVRDMRWHSIVSELGEHLLGEAFDEFMGCAITYGRIPLLDFRSVYCNLEEANLCLYEMAGDLSLIADPEWSAVPFLRKVEEDKRKRDQLGETAHPNPEQSA